jgi:hypothetical protein
MAFDAWYYFLYDKPYPKTYWTKSPKLIKDDELSEKERILLVKYYDIRVEDIDYLLQWFPKTIKDDLKWLMEIEKQNK